jgi:hypothetical protein
MPCELFLEQGFSVGSLLIIKQANEIIAEYQDQDFRLSLRQLFYQFVSRGLLANDQSQYRRLQHTLVNARNAGLVDWDAIEDRTRVLEEWTTFRNPAEAIDVVARQYREDPWLKQQYRPEVWIEKEALIGVIEDVCKEYLVPYLAHRGGNSASVMYEAGKRFAAILDHGQTPVVFHLADHDPTGIHMTEDTERRLEMYADEWIRVDRLGLTMAQVRRYRPPPNMAKESDTRYDEYRRQFGTQCWELDALSPTVIADLIRTNLDNLIDQKLWQASLRKEQRNRATLEQARRPRITPRR